MIVNPSIIARLGPDWNQKFGVVSFDFYAVILENLAVRAKGFCVSAFAL